MAKGLNGGIDERQAADARYNPSDSARDLYRQEHDAIDGYDRNSDGLDDHPVSAGDASGVSGDTGADDPGKNINEAKDQEEAGGGWTNKWSGATNAKGKFDLKATFKKNGPIGAIILLLGGGGIAITGLLSPSLLIVQLTDVLTNNFNDAHTAVSIRTNAVYAEKIGKAKNAFAETSDGKCGIRCKTTTMSDTMVRNLEARGFTVEKDTKSILGVQRHTIQSITFPDGKVVNNGKAFKAALKDPTRAASFAKVFNSRTAYFLNSKFGTIIKHKLGINKAYKLAGDSKEKFNESFRRAIGLPPKVAIDPNKPPASDEEKLNADPRNANVVKSAAIFAAGKGLGVIGGACTAYDGARAISASVKLAKMMRFASFAMVFMNAAHKLKAGDGGGIDHRVMTGLGDTLTYTDPNKTKPDGSPNELYGLSATDSYGVKAAMYGDTGTPPAYAKANSLESSGVLGVLATLAFFASGSPEVRATAHTMCKTTENPLALVAQCAAPAFATGPFAPLSGLICLVANVAIGVVITETLKVIGPIVLAEIIKANVNPLDENTKGVLAGDALYPGAAVTLGGHAASYGLTPGSKDEISSYVAMGEEIRKQDEAIARIEAKETPFDVYNKYSFLGSLAASLNLSAYANSSLTGTASTLASTIPLSLASLTSTTKAGTYMPLSNTKAAQYGNTDCPDVKASTGDPNAACCPALDKIGSAGDYYCIESLTTSSVELNAEVLGNKEWMVTEGYVDDATGAAVKGTERGRQFQLYIDNCVNRVDPWGETTKPISEGESGDYEWFIGAKCREKSDMLYNFRTYGADEPIIAITGGEDSALLPASNTTPQSSGTGTGENSGNVNPDGWAFPTVAGAPLSRGYFTGHLALDIGGDPNNKDLPIYAMRDGIVTSVGNIPMPPYEAGCVGDEGPGSIQQTVVIEHVVDGQKYISTYHHVQRNKFPFAVGDTVKAGDRIATMGNTGCSFGQHLHVELWIGRVWGQSVDLGPILYK